ncbi:hypothetical protein R1sor_011912 [Riccia sorocarpa]|uniref:Retrotransposon gag domain-containing protein n=1 Tax=Riccia sorocarpa TaxID=122646 RepID=A0ABD3I393_9MARC
MAHSHTRLRYSHFRGKSGKDPDTFLQEFLQVSEANKEESTTDRLRIFPGLLKDRASRWYRNTEAATRADWVTFTKAFLAEFRDLEFTAHYRKYRHKYKKKGKLDLRKSSSDQKKKHSKKKESRKESSSSSESSDEDNSKKKSSHSKLGKQVDMNSSFVKLGDSMEQLTKRMAGLSVQLAAP